jgi:ATPase subunit of ABC transporter with duplicated ATPase domains
MAEQKREPKIVMGARKRQAQESAGKLRNVHAAKVDEARQALAAAEEQVRDDREVRVDLPGSRVYPGQPVVELDEVRLAFDPASSGRRMSLTITGPERIALIGANGAGKTTLLRAIAAAGPGVPWRYLPQRLDVFRPDLSVADNVSLVAPQARPGQIRAQLARLLFRGADADVAAGALSGGEQLRAALAMMVLAEPTPRLLMLDEPTNNLDLSALAALTQALSGFAGALVIASHDLAFLRDVGTTRWLELGAGGLVEVDPR